MALENKLGLTSSADLAREEERISKKKAVELFENGVLDTLPAGKFSTLQAIHNYLFEDIYDLAGKLRTVNLAKGNFRFAPLMYLEVALANIDKMPQSTFDEIIEKCRIPRCRQLPEFAEHHEFVIKKAGTHKQRCAPVFNSHPTATSTFLPLKATPYL